MLTGDNPQRSSGRLSVYFEQDLTTDIETTTSTSTMTATERLEIRGEETNDSLETPLVDGNNNNDSIESNDTENILNESQDSNSIHNVTHPPVVVRRRKNNNNTRLTQSRSRERSFVYAAGDAVVGGARTVARTFKRMSLIESSSSSHNNNNSSTGSSMRERTSKESRTSNGVEHLKANSSKLKHYNSTPSLPQSYSSSVGPLQSSGSAQSLGSSPSPSPRNSQVKGVNVVGLTAGSKGSKGSSSNTAKQHEQQSSAVAGISSTSTSSAAAAAAAAGVSLNNNGGMSSNGGVSSGGNIGIATYSVAAGGSVAAIPPEKEKKRKEVSSSRVKKFHRHFSQVSKDEKLINYFSCALVGDIPLQGHLYITEEHFAFYSNVFGYVTKVVIPTSSVTKISKEKTAKIIPNAVGVATADERHVFGSFISRESAFRLMCTVCTQLNPGAEILLPKPLQLLPVDVELTEEYLLDDDSSCSISGNESPPQLRDPAAVLAGDMDQQQQQQQQQQAFLRQRPGSDRHSEMQTKASLDVIDGPVTIRSSAPPVVHYEEPMQAHLQQLNSPGRHLFSSALPTVMGNGSGVSGSSASSSSSPVTVVGMGVCVAVPTTPINTGAPAGGAGGAGEGNPAAAAAAAAAPRSRWRLMAATARTRLSLDVPALTELQVLYLGITLAVLLAIFSVFLLYRVLDIEAKTSLYNMPVDFNAHGGNDDDIFAEALRWQRELQDKSTAEAQHILAKNLEQISKVRRSLETLSMLIHDRRAGYGKPQTDMDLMAQNGGAAAAGDVSD